ncbi:MAG: Hsp33 family molecular chaperone HslO [Gammaproteobacteria bacterium]|nr:Hsp33 family molecular chaperone HslO [Gammaproteobacteria bacterium]
MSDSPNPTQENDRLQRFMFEQLDIRGALARLDDAWAGVRDAQSYPEPVQRLLGEMLTATALLASIVKVKGTLTVQATGDGPLAAVMAECRDRTRLRGIARIRDEDAFAEGDIADGTSALGTGLITITIRPELGDRAGEAYQGIVPMDGSSLAEALEGYFVQSEQIPTRMWLAADSGRAAGMLIQALPPELARFDHAEGQREEDFGRISLLAGTVSASELKDLPGQQLLSRLFFEETLSLQPAESLEFSCSCSHERTREALRAMPLEELQQIIKEDGDIRMTCQFCHAEYRFDGIDVAAVHAQASAQAPPSGDQLH